jgi:hypothetical protein
MIENKIFRPATILVTSILSISMTGCLYFRSHPMGIEPNARYTDYFNYEILGDAEGSSSSMTLIGLFPVTPGIKYEEAVNEAIRSKGGDNLIEVTSWRERKVYIVGVVDVLHVKGKAIRYISDTVKN